MMLLLGLAVLAGCGVDGAPVPPGSDIDPNNITNPRDFDPEGFF
jgi:predicted small lipoprotein YifL